MSIERFALDIPMHIRASNQLLSHDSNTKQLRLARHDPRNGTCRWVIEKHAGHHHIRCVNDRPDGAMYVGVAGAGGELCLYTGPGAHTCWNLERTGRGNMYKFNHTGITTNTGQLQLIVHKQSDNTSWLVPYKHLVRMIEKPSMHESWMSHLASADRSHAERVIFCTTDTFKHHPGIIKTIDQYAKLDKLQPLGDANQTHVCDGNLSVVGKPDAYGSRMLNTWRQYQQATSGVSMHHHEHINSIDQLRDIINTGGLKPDTPVYKADTHSLLQSFLHMCGLYDGRDKQWYHAQQLSFFTGDAFFADVRSLNTHDTATYARVLSELQRMNKHKHVGDQIMQRVWLYMLTPENFTGPVAQRLEQRTHNPLVVGSNPTGPTKFAKQMEQSFKQLTHTTHQLQQIDPLLEQALSKKSFSKSSLTRLLKPLAKLFAPD